MKITFKPLYGDKDEKLNSNPDRGLFGQANLNVRNIDLYNASGNVFFPARENDLEPGNVVEEFNRMDSCEGAKLMKVYVYPVGYEDCEIDERGIERIQHMFDFAREKGFKIIFRPVYRHSYQKDGNNGEVDEAVIMRHIQQMKPLLEKNKDVIFVTEAGVLGTCGEWWDAYPRWTDKNYDLEKVMTAFLDATPEELYMGVRQPYYRNDVIKDTSLFSRMGHFNDAIFGHNNVNKGEDSIVPDKEGWKIICDESPYVPCGGELYWGEWCYSEGSDGEWRRDGKAGREWVEAYDFIEQAVEHHFSYLSMTNNYSGPKGQPFSMDLWRITGVIPEWCFHSKVLYQPEWFKNSDGTDRQCNAFEFVKSHLGYRIALEDAEIHVKGDGVNISLNLKNYGFSRPYNLKYGFAVLDCDGNVISETESESFADWQPWDPVKGTRGVAVEHNVTAEFKLPKENKGCKLAFFLRNSAGNYASFANDITVINGYHILTEI